MQFAGDEGLTRSNDQLFVFDEAEAYPPKAAAPKWIKIAAAYKTAADQLLAQAKQENRLDPANLYPIVFLYRHFIEMEVKSILLLSYIGLEDGEAKQKTSTILHIHDPKRLAEELLNSSGLSAALNSPSRYLGEDYLGWDETIKVLQGFIRILQQLSSLDASSYTFRYTVTKNLSPTTVDLHGLSLSNLEGVAARFEATSRWIRRLLEQHIDDTVNRDLSDSGMFNWEL